MAGFTLRLENTAAVSVQAAEGINSIIQMLISSTQSFENQRIATLFHRGKLYLNSAVIIEEPTVSSAFNKGSSP